MTTPNNRPSMTTPSNRSPMNTPNKPPMTTPSNRPPNDLSWPLLATTLLRTLLINCYSIGGAILFYFTVEHVITDTRGSCSHPVLWEGCILDFFSFWQVVVSIRETMSCF
jgi:hypothetical protein